MQTFSSTFAPILQAMSNEEFTLRAFEDYTQKKTNKYQNLLNVLTELVDDIDDDVDDYVDIDASSNIIQQAISKCSSVGDQYLCLDGGYILLSEFLVKYYNGTAHDILDEDSYLCQTEDIGLIKPSGNLSGITTTINGAIQNIKDSLHSCTSITAACSAMKESTPAGKITVYKDKLNQFFNQAVGDISGAATPLLDIVTQSPDVKTFITSLSDFMGIRKLADDQEDEIPMNSKMHEFTGASPMGPLCFDSVGSAISTVVNVGAKVVGSIFSAIGSGLSSIFKSASSAIHRLACDPYDLGVFNDNSTCCTIDGFCWQYSGVMSSMFPSNLDQEIVLASVEKVLNDLVAMEANQFIAFKLHCAELLIKITGYSRHESYIGSTVVYSYHIEYTIQVKFLPMKKQVFDSIMKNCFRVTGETDPDGVTVKALGLRSYTSYADWCTLYASSIYDPASIYNNEDVSEKELYRSYVRSIFLMKMLAIVFGWSKVEEGSTIIHSNNKNGFSTPSSDNAAIGVIPIQAYTNEDLDSSGRMSVDINTIDSILYVPDTVRNDDFLKIACGWDGEQFNYLQIIDDPWGRLRARAVSENHSEDYYLTYDIRSVNGIIHQALNHSLDEEIFPLDFPFIPYRKGSEGFTSSRFYIKSDAENQKAFNNFAVTVIIVAVAAVAIITTGAIAAKIARKLTEKRIMTVGQLDNKIWSGGKPTAKEWRKYRRANKKLSASSKVTEGLSGASEKVQNTDTSIAPKILELLGQP